MEFPWAKKIPDWMRPQSATADLDRQTADDREIAVRLIEIFEEPGLDLDVEGVQFYVFKGAVSLYGRMPSSEERNRLLHVISEVEGVTRVVDHFDRDAEENGSAAQNA